MHKNCSNLKMIIYLCCLLSIPYIDSQSVKAYELTQLNSQNNYTDNQTDNNEFLAANPQPTVTVEITNADELRNDLHKKISDYRTVIDHSNLASNIILGLSIALAFLIAITGTSKWFKDSSNRWAHPLGLSVAAWLGTISATVGTVQNTYKFSSEAGLYRQYSLEAYRLLDMLRNPLASTNDAYIACIRKQNRFLIDAENERRELLPEHYPECNNPVPAPTSPVSKAEVTLLDPKAAKEISKLKGHQGSVAFSPDGQTLATSGDDETIRLWNTKGQLLKTFKFQGNQTAITSIDFGPNRQKLVSGDAGGKIHLWDLQGNLLTEFVASQKMLRSVKFNPKNEQQLASTGDDGIIYLWNLQGQSLAQWPADPEQVWDLEFSPDGQQIASAEARGIVRLWNWQGKPLHQFKEHIPHSVLSVAFSPDSKQLVSSCNTGMFRSWSLQDYNEKNRFDDVNNDVKLNSVAYGLGGKLIVGGDNQGHIRLWKVNNQRPSPFWTSPDQKSNIRKVAFSPDGKHFATAADDGIVKLWQLVSVEG